jgi:hypothetical protein
MGFSREAWFAAGTGACPPALDTPAAHLAQEYKQLAIKKKKLRRGLTRLDRLREHETKLDRLHEHDR